MYLVNSVEDSTMDRRYLAKHGLKVIPISINNYPNRKIHVINLYTRLYIPVN